MALSVVATLTLEFTDILDGAGALLVAIFGAAPLAIVLGLCDLLGYDINIWGTEMTASVFVAAVLYYSALLYLPLRVKPKRSVYIFTAVIHLLIGVSVVFYALFQWQR